MRIAYLGLDEVNRYLARRWARRLSIPCQPVDVQALGVPRNYLAIVVDLDSLPSSHRRRWLSWLTSLGRRAPALVFGHTISDDERDVLRASGVSVRCRALRRSILRRFIEREVYCAA